MSATKPVKNSRVAPGIQDVTHSINFSDPAQEAVAVGWASLHGLNDIPPESIPSAHDFVDERCRLPWIAILALHRAGRPINPNEVTHHLKELGLDQRMAQLFQGSWELWSSHLDSGHMVFQTAKVAITYFDALRRLSQKRKAHQTAKDLHDGTIDPAEAIRRLGEIEESSQLAAPKLSFRRISDIVAMEFDDADSYLGDRLIAAGQSTTFIGPGGIGKSRILVQLAMSMIVGRVFLDMPTNAIGKKWLILQTENSLRRLKADILKMLGGIKLTDDELAQVDQNLVFHTLEHDADGYLDVEDLASLGRIEAAISEHQPDVVVFDPLNTFTSLDLNKDQDMKAVTRAISGVVWKGNRDRALIVVHHSLTGKAGAAKAVGWDGSSYGRNSKALYNWSRAQINVAPRDPDDPNLLVVAVGKNNNGQKVAPIGVVYVEARGIYCQDTNFDLSSFKESVGIEDAKSSKASISSPEVAELIDGESSKSDLVRRIMAETGVAKSRAYEIVDKAEREKAIIRKRGAGSKYVRGNPMEGAK